MAKTKTKEIIEKVLISPVFISLMVFLLAALVVYRLTITKVDSAYDRQFIRDVLVEAHGMLFDILIIGTFIFALHTLVESRREKKHNIERWQEEIDDFLGWDEKEATFRIMGNIRRLNKNGITVIYLSGCFLKNAELSHVNLRDANLFLSNLEGANLIFANFEGANLNEAILEEADLYGANFEGANLELANLRGVSLQEANLEGAILLGADLQKADPSRANFEGANLESANLRGVSLWEANLEGANLSWAHLEEASELTLEQLSKVKTLYKAKLDRELEKQIKDKYPHLFEKSEWLKEKKKEED